MKLKITILLVMCLLWTCFVNAQNQFSDYVEYSKVNQTEIRLNNIDKQLQQYGKQSLIGDRILLTQIVFVVGGAALSIPATPLLIITSACELTNVLISKRADKKLSKYQSR